MDRIYINGNFEVVKGTISNDETLTRYFVKQVGVDIILESFKYKESAIQVCNMYAKNVSSIQYI